MSTYKKHTWGSGIPNRKKFDEMDSEIQRLAEGGGGLPPTGNLHEILKVGSSGPMWGKADSDFVNYIETPTHENGSVGAKLSELSEKIVNISNYIQFDSTQPTTTIKKVGKWVDGTTDVYETTIHLSGINSGWNNPTLSGLSITNVVDISGIYHRVSDGKDTYVSLNSMASANNNELVFLNFEYENSTVKFNIYVGTNFGNGDIYVTIRFI